MNAELEKARSYSENKQYKEALEILLALEQNTADDIPTHIKVLEEIFKNYKSSGDLNSALEYYKKFSEYEYNRIVSENTAKTEKLTSAMKIHSAQKETNMLQEKNTELQKANEDLGILREKKNEILTSISEELKLPIVTIEGIAFNYYRAIKEGKEINIDEMKNDLQIVETLSQEILQNVNSILQKNKEEHR